MPANLMTDVVFWGTLVAAILFLIAGILYAYGIRKGFNGNTEDAFMALLFLALFSNYGYLWFARLMMYMDYERFMFLLVRTKYVPPVYLTIIIMLPLIWYKYKQVTNKKGGE